MYYLLDTVTIIRHFTDTGKMPKKAKDILAKTDNHFIISVVSLMEILYLSEKKRINISLSETIDQIESSSLYTSVDLNPDILKIAEVLLFPELHDRLILSTAKWLEIPIISSDKAFQSVEKVEVIWD